MATPKTKAVKTTKTTKAAPKKTVTKKKVEATKKATATKTTRAPRVTKSVARQPEYQTLHASHSAQPFFSFAVTRQTFYWLIILGLVLALGAWVISLQVKINDLYDKIDQNQAIVTQTIVRKKAPTRSPVEQQPPQQ